MLSFVLLRLQENHRFSLLFFMSFFRFIKRDVKMISRCSFFSDCFRICITIYIFNSPIAGLALTDVSFSLFCCTFIQGRIQFVCFSGLPQLYLLFLLFGFHPSVRLIYLLYQREMIRQQMNHL